MLSFQCLTGDWASFGESWNIRIDFSSLEVLREKILVRWKVSHSGWLCWCSVHGENVFQHKWKAESMAFPKQSVCIGMKACFPVKNKNKNFYFLRELSKKHSKNFNRNHMMMSSFNFYWKVFSVDGNLKLWIFLYIGSQRKLFYEILFALQDVSRIRWNFALLETKRKLFSFVYQHTKACSKLWSEIYASNYFFWLEGKLRVDVFFLPLVFVSWRQLLSHPPPQGLEEIKATFIRKHLNVSVLYSLSQKRRFPQMCD